MDLIVGLDHVNLLIDDSDDALERARAFYCELLGIEQLERPSNTESGQPGLWFQCGAAGASDHEPGRIAYQPFVATTSRVPRPMRARFETAGVETVAGNRCPSQERFFAHDPWGNRLEFVERTST